MKLIEQFKYKQYRAEDDSLKAGFIKIEYKRPIFFLENDSKELFKIDYKKMAIYKKRLIVNPFAEGYFELKDIKFLSKHYGFLIKEDEEYKGYYSSFINDSYTNSGEFLLINNRGKEYVIIEFERSDSNEPTQMEDQWGLGFTYIHGIWEDPILTDSIRKKLTL